ncbi:MAG: hypothetical protein O2855_06215 [Planctomycetota bacterium]|nr:hypothetical protein [Planctomycetota bacterium]
MNRKLLLAFFLAAVAAHLWVVWPRDEDSTSPSEATVQEERVALRRVTKQTPVAQVSATPEPEAELEPMPDPQPMPAPQPTPAPIPEPAVVALVEAAEPAPEAERPPDPMDIAPIEHVATVADAVIERSPTPTERPQPPQPQPVPAVRVARRESAQSPGFKWIRRDHPDAVSVQLPARREQAASTPAFPWLKENHPAQPVAVAAPAPARPVVLANAAPSPVATGGVRVADRGASGGTAGQRLGPVARIAWGSPDDALRVVSGGRLELVAVGDDLKVCASIIQGENGWKRVSPRPGLSTFSNKVRVVEHVSAFTEIAAACQPREHLAVLVPVVLERRIESAMAHAASQAGLRAVQLEACFGRLVPGANGVVFEIDRIERTQS